MCSCLASMFTLVAVSNIKKKNGKLLEAGGLIFSDAKGWSYGRGDTARELHSLAPYASVRETDYGSAACIMVPRALFVRLGLYDRFFLPACKELSAESLCRALCM